MDVWLAVYREIQYWLAVWLDWLDIWLALAGSATLALLWCRGWSWAHRQAHQREASGGGGPEGDKGDGRS